VTITGSTAAAILVTLAVALLAFLWWDQHR
jgi:hypothetical protein